MKRTTPEEVLEILQEVTTEDGNDNTPFTRSNVMSAELREFLKDEKGYAKYMESTQKV